MVRRPLCNCVLYDIVTVAFYKGNLWVLRMRGQPFLENGDDFWCVDKHIVREAVLQRDQWRSINFFIPPTDNALARPREEINVGKAPRPFGVDAPATNV